MAKRIFILMNGFEPGPDLPDRAVQADHWVAFKGQSQARLTSVGLRRLATVCPLSDNALIRLAQGADFSLSQEGVNLATALFHERLGTHKAGQSCDGCDPVAAQKYAAVLLGMA